MGLPVWLHAASSSRYLSSLPVLQDLLHACSVHSHTARQVHVLSFHGPCNSPHVSLTILEIALQVSAALCIQQQLHSLLWSIQQSLGNDSLHKNSAFLQTRTQMMSIMNSRSFQNAVVRSRHCMSKIDDLCICRMPLQDIASHCKTTLSA